jgi:exodeoxyribonuclease VII large subunit
MDMVYTVSDFVAVFNQTIEYVYPTVTIVGELANYRISKNKWIYFDLKDESSSIRFFGTIYALPGPLEEGMMIQVVGSPRLHQNFGFSLTVKSIVPVGEGSIKKAFDLLRATLTKEGLLNADRKRSLPYPPARIGLVTSGESAAYKDFIKILGARWGGIEIIHSDVQVQGEAAPAQIIEAISKLNTHDALDVIVVTRGGGSADDLQAFNNEQVVRAIASSRTPTLVAIGHEVDVSLSELVADKRASTPSNAAELLVPDKKVIRDNLQLELSSCLQKISHSNRYEKDALQARLLKTKDLAQTRIRNEIHSIQSMRHQLIGYNPQRVLSRGYALVRQNDISVVSIAQLEIGSSIEIRFADGLANAEVQSFNGRKV